MDFSAKEYFNRLDSFWEEPDWVEFRHDQMDAYVDALKKEFPDVYCWKAVGRSFEGRSLEICEFGKGTTRVMLFCRQHGDEPDCTAGLLVMLRYLAMHQENPVVSAILSKLRFMIFPLVNPDGTERFTRRGAHQIDINRDGTRCATPEGRALMKAVEDFVPDYCFTLHDMDPRYVHDQGELAAIAFQACPPSAEPDGHADYALARNVAGVMARAAGEIAPGHVARYAADYMPTAFGDTVAGRGIPTVLLEAGGWFPKRGGDLFVRRLFAASLLAGLVAVIDGIAPEADGSYETIPLTTKDRFVDLLITGGRVRFSMDQDPILADIAINRVIHGDGSRYVRNIYGVITDIGDLSRQKTKDIIDARGCIVEPGSHSFEMDHQIRTGEHDWEPDMVLRTLKRGCTTIVCHTDLNKYRDFLSRAPINFLVCDEFEPLRIFQKRCGNKGFSDWNESYQGRHRQPIYQSSIKVDGLADLVVRPESSAKSELRFVIVNGSVVFRDGALDGECADA